MASVAQHGRTFNQPKTIGAYHFTATFRVFSSIVKLAIIVTIAFVGSEATRGVTMAFEEAVGHKNTMQSVPIDVPSTRMPHALARS